MKFKKGDIIISKNFPNVEREIVDKDGKGYLWQYPDMPKGEFNLYTSLNSNDPSMEFWELKK